MAEGKGARGEGYLEVDGERLAVLFTNRALAEAEQSTGKPVLQFVSPTTCGMADLVQLLAIGLEHARRETKSRKAPYTVREAYEIMDQLGFTDVATAIIGSVGAVLNYSSKKSTDDAEDDEEADEPAPPA